MTTLGQLLLLAAFVCSGYSGFACVVGGVTGHARLERTGAASAACVWCCLTAACMLLAHALLVTDNRFAYVNDHSSRILPWYYSLSALWVGQAGSLLVWAWLTTAVAWAYRFAARRHGGVLRAPAFGAMMIFLCFLLTTIVFAANPMVPAIVRANGGAKLSPLLQHPVMLVHPPVVFLGYALWTVPFALGLAALVTGKLDRAWIGQSRPWSLAAWAVLGIGLLLGANWAYEELGWGGYWAWDPVENGSLIPWLVGTALVHVALVWQYRGGLKKTTLALVFATFGLCCFSTFVTRSGLFVSVHAFGRSSVGWTFLGLITFLLSGGIALILWRRSSLAADHRIMNLWTREAMILLASVALLLLAAVILVGTLSIPLSTVLLERKIAVGQAFYNKALLPIGLLLLATTAAAPLLQWGQPPDRARRKTLLTATILGSMVAVTALITGTRHPISLAIAWLSATTMTVLLSSIVLSRYRSESSGFAKGLPHHVWTNRRQYTGFAIHLGFVSLVIGIAGSSLGSRRASFVMEPGQSVRWANRSIHYVSPIERSEPDKLVMGAKLRISMSRNRSYHLTPAQHFHPLQEEWTTEMAIHSGWWVDFCAIVHGPAGANGVRLTFIENPMVAWIWISGWIVAAATFANLGTRFRSSARQEA